MKAPEPAPATSSHGAWLRVAPLALWLSVAVVGVGASWFAACFVADSMGARDMQQMVDARPVSYTHLTLPTIYSV